MQDVVDFLYKEIELSKWNISEALKMEQSNKVEPYIKRTVKAIEDSKVLMGEYLHSREKQHFKGRFTRAIKIKIADEYIKGKHESVQ